MPILSKKNCGDCWAFRIIGLSNILQCLANDKFRGTCQGSRKRVRFDMKYVGWNIGAVRIEREESKADIEILEMKIDGVDILKLLDSSLFRENENV